MMTLAQIGGDKEKQYDVIVRTSAVESALASHLRDGVEQILSSGIDPFEEKDPSTVASEESKQQDNLNLVRQRRSTAFKRQSAGAKYAKQLLQESNKKKNKKAQGRPTK